MVPFRVEMFAIVGAHGLDGMGLVRGERRAGAEGAWYGFQREVGKACERDLGGEGW